MPDDAVEQVFRARAFEIAGWADQNDPIRLELSPKCTVLVGKNAAGKSLLLEGILRGCKNSAGQPDKATPVSFKLEATTAEGVALVYEHHLTPVVHEGGVTSLTLRESCWAENDQNHPYWRSENGTATLKDDTELALPKGVGLLGVDIELPQAIDGLVRSLKQFLRFSTCVRAGVPRVGLRTTAWRFRKSDSKEWGMGGYSRFDTLSENLLWASEEAPGLVDELRAVATRVGLLNDLSVGILRPADVPDGKLPRDLGIISVDGVDLGLASDGTLRALEILWAMVFGFGGTMLMIEEPETGFHPGLVSRLLSEIESYSSDRQVVMSTHSQQVVSRFSADNLRLVSRQAGKTVLTKLTASQAGRVAQYLADEGTLGDFVFGGGADE